MEIGTKYTLEIEEVRDGVPIAYHDGHPVKLDCGRVGEVVDVKVVSVGRVSDFVRGKVLNEEIQARRKAKEREAQAQQKAKSRLEEIKARHREEEHKQRERVEELTEIPSKEEIVNEQEDRPDYDEEADTELESKNDLIRRK
ncbi:hypothetical protein [Halorussus salinisoli]|uniref:hypothetical protein n=1 Tax=Halorussus salinisoli TaxID=2558242 RepID=UPI0010C19D95|nr:hypothetical protein [Halorussus salinisoli]